MPINPNVNYQQVLSMALEERSSAWQDIVSDAIPFFAMLREKNMWKSYSGPNIRQTLRINLPEIQYYSGFDFLAAPPIEMFNDASFTPKMAAVPISLTMQEILNNDGENQLLDVMGEYIQGAEAGMEQGLEMSVFSDGSGFNGKEIGGLDVAIPETPMNVYGNISRAEHEIWRTQAFDMSTDFPDIGTEANSTTIKAFYDRAMGEMTRGRNSPDIIFASPDHWEAYSAAVGAIQRITRSDGAIGRLGFRTLEYVGPGGNAEIVWGGGRGSQMPDNTSFFIKSDTFRMRYNENRNFSTLFDGDGQKPINQDAIVQFVGFMGEITMTNPAFNGRLFSGA